MNLDIIFKIAGVGIIRSYRHDSRTYCCYACDNR